MKTVFSKSIIFIEILTLTLTLVFVPLCSICQVIRPGTIEYLKYNNGFNGIKLGADLGSISSNKLAFLDGNSSFDADSCLSFEYKDTTILKIGELASIDLVGIRTYKNKIINIYLFFSRAISYKVLYDFLTLYGNFTNRPYFDKDMYYWNSSMVNLSLTYELKVDMGVAIFTCNPLNKELISSRLKNVGKPLANNDLNYHREENTAVLSNVNN
jgi:hypothetical protein